VAWQVALQRRDGPTGIILSRQSLPILEKALTSAPDDLTKGGYVLRESSAETPDVILLASGSEVHVALGAQDILEEQGITTRVVNMASWELFDAQSRQYRDKVLPPSVSVRLAVEAASPMGWEKYVGQEGEVVGLDRFGASAPYKVLMSKFGFEPQAVAERVQRLLTGSE
jgi:transketolase